MRERERERDRTGHILSGTTSADAAPPSMPNWCKTKRFSLSLSLPGRAHSPCCGPLGCLCFREPPFFLSETAVSFMLGITSQFTFHLQTHSLSLFIASRQTVLQGRPMESEPGMCLVLSFSGRHPKASIWDSFWPLFAPLSDCFEYSLVEIVCGDGKCFYLYVAPVGRCLLGAHSGNYPTVHRASHRHSSGTHTALSWIALSLTLSHSHPAQY